MLRTARNRREDVVSRETGLDFTGEPVLTVQSEKDNCDINVILRRFKVTGQMPPPTRLPSYGDYDQISDFQTAMNAVRLGEELFNELPSAVRKRFANSPQEFLEFVANPDNGDELVKLGIASKRVSDIIAPSVDVPPVKEKGNARDPGKRAGKAAKASEGSSGDSGGEQEGS